jgi:hypothetical protein
MIIIDFKVTKVKNCVGNMSDYSDSISQTNREFPMLLDKTN